MSLDLKRVPHRQSSVRSHFSSILPRHDLIWASLVCLPKLLGLSPLTHEGPTAVFKQGLAQSHTSAQKRDIGRHEVVDPPEAEEGVANPSSCALFCSSATLLTLSSHQGQVALRSSSGTLRSLPLLQLCVTLLTLKFNLSPMGVCSPPKFLKL